MNTEMRISTGLRANCSGGDARRRGWSARLPRRHPTPKTRCRDIRPGGVSGPGGVLTHGTPARLNRVGHNRPVTVVSGLDASEQAHPARLYYASGSR